MDETVITVRGLDVELGGVRVLDGFDLDVRRGEFLSIMGANGAGKSTLLRCLAGLQRPAAGEVAVFGRRPVDGPEFWRDVVHIADEPSWYPWLSVREHVDLMRAVHGEVRLDTDAALELFDLTGRDDAAPARLSTGQRQRLSLAMGLVRPSRLLLLDEPERGLDLDFRDRLKEIFVAYTVAGGTLVMVTHDDDLAWSTRRLRLEAAG
ncbi:ABC transporter ATP-binding protein [Actinomadura sp. WAC 06369]|uniref:ABC transporter ATP-binding protein n=1 Tax=Actinomadura sp. WAC 06369 TaxID=2203193 RepID=UPI000F78A34C|nr:ABC transporter ATP-binding protein [Actinomadura sp. WAC 06369]RSN46535.1 heme ABC exporter ATP-binding protein CcmA [Actinomadura sp. WAC 06369]